MTSWASVFWGNGADWVLFNGRCFGSLGRLLDGRSFMARGDWGWGDIEPWPDNKVTVYTCYSCKIKVRISQRSIKDGRRANAPVERIFCCLICSFWRRCWRRAWWLGLTLDSRPVWRGTGPRRFPGRPCLISVDLADWVSTKDKKKEHTFNWNNLEFVANYFQTQSVISSHF